MMTATHIHDEPAQHSRGLSAGGIGAIFLLAQKVELIREIDRKLRLLKRHLPYHESDHVRNIAFNLLAGGQHIGEEIGVGEENVLRSVGRWRADDRNRFQAIAMGT